jgi:uncharacterized Tic20 family protein
MRNFNIVLRVVIILLLELYVAINIVFYTINNYEVQEIVSTLLNLNNGLPVVLLILSIVLILISQIKTWRK